MPAEANPLFMRRAIELAARNVEAGLGGPFAALIVRDGIVVGEAANSVTTTNDPTAHGEINAIRKACAALQTFSLEGCEIYTSCEPCPMCLAAIYWARIELIYYGSSSEDAARAGFNDSYLYKEIRLGHQERAVPARQLLGPEAWHCFQVWIEATSKIDY